MHDRNATYVSTLEYLLEKYNESLTGAVPDIVDKYFYMGSPMPVATTILIYLAYIYYWGPRHMKNRPAYELQNIIIFYNAFQMLYNIYMLYLYYAEKSFPAYFLSFGCAHVTEKARHAFFMSAYNGFWFFTINKALDLFDTVFFVLRKKTSHITFLHVYHHVGTLAITWALAKYYPGHEPAIVGILNTFVHSVMYFYYLIAALGPKYRKFLWWKRYITILQILQFLCILSYNTLCLFFSCDMNLSVVKAIMIHSGMNLLLFLNFYYHAYVKPAKKQQQKQQYTEVNANGKKIN